MSPEQVPRHIPGIPDLTQPLDSLLGKAQSPVPGLETGERRTEQDQAAALHATPGAHRAEHNGPVSPLVLEASSLAIGWKHGRNLQSSHGTSIFGFGGPP